MNWKVIKTINILILAVAGISLLAPSGFAFIPALTEKVFIAQWGQILGVALFYVIWSYNKLIHM